MASMFGLNSLNGATPSVSLGVIWYTLIGLPLLSFNAPLPNQLENSGDLVISAVFFVLSSFALMYSPESFTISSSTLGSACALLVISAGPLPSCTNFLYI